MIISSLLAIEDIASFLQQSFEILHTIVTNIRNFLCYILYLQFWAIDIFFSISYNKNFIIIFLQQIFYQKVDPS